MREKGEKEGRWKVGRMKEINGHKDNLIVGASLSKSHVFSA